jgi:hypothetical protein
MKSVLTRILLLFALLILGACGGENTPNPNNPGGNGAVANPDQFMAVATSAISVQLTWSEVAGATKYLLERKITSPANLVDADFVPWLELSVGQTTYEDFLVPDDANVAYRVKASNASGSSTGKEASATTSVLIPNPLTVQATFDTTLSKSALLGAAGGTLSVTGANGVIYTLTVPADALPEDQTLTLTPFIDLTGSPLSGGTLGAVRIEPEDLLFFVPATLSIELPSPTPDDGLLTVGFAFEGSGSEFHLVLSAQPNATPAVISAQGKPKIINVPANKGGSKGAGRGTKNNVNNQTKNNPPTKPADQQQQQKATQEVNDDELTELVHPLASEGRQTELASAVATSWEEIVTAESEFGTWLDKVLEERKKRNDPEFLEAREEAIAAALSLSEKVRMEVDVKICKQPSLIELHIYLLKHPGTLAQQSIQRAWNKRFASSILEDIQKVLNQCWEWKGTATGSFDLSSAKGKITLEVLFHPKSNADVQNSLIEYTVEVISSKLAYSGPCTIKISEPTTDPSLVKFAVDFKNASENRLSYLGLSFSSFDVTYRCPPNQADNTVPILINWMSTSATFIESPSAKRIKGNYEGNGLTSTWDYSRHSPKN